jgi:hypothetical protein
MTPNTIEVKYENAVFQKPTHYAYPIPTFGSTSRAKRLVHEQEKREHRALGTTITQSPCLPKRNHHPLAISSTLFPPPSASHPHSHYTPPAHALHRTYPPYIANSQPHYQTSCPSYCHYLAISSNPPRHYNYPLQRKHTTGSCQVGSMTTFCGTAATGCSIDRSRRGSRSSRR